MTETEEEVKRRLARKASRAVVGGSTANIRSFGSWLGHVGVSLPGEGWPLCDGRPMLPLCQFNLTEIPYRPDSLADVALIAVFLSPEDLPLSTANGDQWLLRAYPALEDLVPLARPDERFAIKAQPVRWELVEADYPTWDYADALNIPDSLKWDYDDIFETQDGTKIGGWPATIQSEIYWAPFNQHAAQPEYVFQVASEEAADWQWGDAGTGYFGRGTGDMRHVWTFEWQCY